MKDLFTKQKAILTLAFLLANLAALTAVQTIFNTSKFSSNQAIYKSISEIFKNEIHFSNFEFTIRTIQSLKKTKLIDCIEAKVKKPIVQVLLSSKKNNCQNSHLWLTNKPSTQTFRWDNGVTWTLTYRIQNSSIFVFFLMSFRILSILGTSFFVLYYFKRKETEKQRTQWIQKQEKSFQSLTQQTIHDIASPMSALNLIAGHPSFPSETNELFKSAISRIYSIISDLQTSKVELVNVNLAITEIVGEKNKTENVDISISCPVDAAYSFSKSQFQRVISNLLNNSIEQGILKEVSPRIFINVSTGQNLKIEVSDNCGGIAESFTENLFSRGYSTKDSTGLGLHHAKCFVEEQNGEIKIENNKQDGSTVTIVFPG